MTLGHQPKWRALSAAADKNGKIGMVKILSMGALRRREGDENGRAASGGKSDCGKPQGQATSFVLNSWTGISLAGREVKSLRLAK